MYEDRKIVYSASTQSAKRHTWAERSCISRIKVAVRFAKTPSQIFRFLSGKSREGLLFGLPCRECRAIRACFETP